MLIMNDGSQRIDSGPAMGGSISFHGSHKSGSSGVTSSPIKGTSNFTPVLMNLQNNFVVHNGILTVYVPKDVNGGNNNTNNLPGHNAEKVPVIGHGVLLFLKTFSQMKLVLMSLLILLSIKMALQLWNHQKKFLTNARKLWSSSIIGHFIGGSFEFIFVRDQAFKFWKK